MMKYAQFAKSAIAANVDTGKILFKKHPFKKLPPASMTKIMTLLLAMERLRYGKMKVTDRVTVSRHAASTRGSSLFLRPGEVLQLWDLLKGIVLVSGNDAAVTLAEHMAGTEASFVKLMNNKAKALGLANTHFVNSHGMDHKNHFSCAYDMLIMSKTLLRHKKILKLTALRYARIQSNRRRRMMLKNTNTLLGSYRGVDGLKTGTTPKAKYCLTATAKRQNARVIAIVMGEPTARKRNRELIELLDFALSSL
ncbi:D-alanyl-D-alanine carboxypeptidase [Paenibacillus filicis]|uniref:D-alanyl-D-alanine carboxypeptidase n=1 Tax=Paenibacillus gyeongsangnamensis TaxID=3388067 RepID=A0ABT4QFM1_9BACL|nr:D-alanyl-D-alanine carboxypeptidase family protein [Paenibacillus filicis]MCZ8515656.1 D-alanyl-D-alanine carboxypeptidase [Paenibacillus filicis]